MDAASGASETTPLVKREESGSSVAFRVRALTAIASLAEGYDIGVVNGVLVPMVTEMRLSDRQTGLAVGVTPLFMALSALLSGSLADAIGRKHAIAVSSLLLVLGNATWATSSSVEGIYVGRALLGCGIGLGLSTVTMYMAEAAPAKIRGMYASLEELFLNVGIILGFFAGVALLGLENDWRIMVILGAVPAAIVLICVETPYFPESPRYLQAVGRRQEAEEVLSGLLGGDKVEMQQTFDSWDEEAKRRAAGTIPNWPETLRRFGTTQRAQALAGIGCGLMQMLGGIPVLTMYSSYLLTRGGGLSLQEAARATLAIGIVKTMAILISVFTLLDGWGRRPLLHVSAALCGASALFVSYSHSRGLGGAFLVLGLGLFSIGFGVGVGPVTYAYIAEVFDNETRAKGVSIALFFSRLVASLYAGLTPMARASIGISGIFVALAGFNLLALIYYYLFCPETKGLRLEDIHKVFARP